jgi:hypothetical protein
MSVYAPEAPSDEALAAWETDESDESDELAEARRERRWTRPQVARPSTYQRPGGPGGGLPRPSGGPGGPVTQSQLDSAIALAEARIAAQIKTNSDAIQRVNQHVETVNAERRSLATNQKREDTALRREIQQTRETVILLSLLTPRPQSVAFSDLQDSDKVVVDRGTDSFTSFLPLLLLMSPGGLGGGAGGSANGSSSGGGMDQSGLLFAALLLGRR